MRQDNQLDVSVVIPVRDSMRYLGETLESVCAQTIAPAEIIVVDDASLDGSAAFASDYSDLVKVVRSGGVGPEGARTVGCEAASHQVIAFCDADDLWHPVKLERQRQLISDVDRPTLVWTGLTEFVSPDISADEYTGRAPKTDIIDGRLPSCLMFTTATLDVERTTLAASKSWVSWVAGLPESVLVERVADILVRRRLHVNNLSLRTHEHQHASWLVAARERVRRQREGRS